MSRTRRVVPAVVSLLLYAHSPCVHFAGAQTNVELPDLASLPVQWANYVDGQDLVGFDRDRIRDKGDEYLARAVEASID